MSENFQTIQKLEIALRQLARLLKAVGYYPARHPALNAAAEEARQAFVPLLPPSGHLLCGVRKDGFLLADQPVASGHAVLRKLALHLFARRVQSILLLPDLTERDLKAFARALTLDPAAIQSQGGMAGILYRVKVSTLWVNETDLSQIQMRKAELDAAKEDLPGDQDSLDAELEMLFASAPPKPAGEEDRDLGTILNELRQENSEQHYRLLLQEMIPLVRQALAEIDRYLIVEALHFLYKESGDPKRSSLRRGLARQALDQLATPEILDSLVALLCTRGMTEPVRGQIFTLLALYPEKSVRRLMDQLAVENELSARRLLLDALAAPGPAATPHLMEYLGDTRWFVVRNAVSVLGEIRDLNAAAALTPFLNYPDLRVARETIRALTKIGGTRAVGLLLALVEREDPDLARQALLSLGALKNAAAVPTLRRVIDRPDPLGKRVDLKKGTIKALGEIGATEAAPSLVSILKRRPLWRRSQGNELRAAAASALGEIGAVSAIPALQTAAEDRSETVARAAAHALKQIRKSGEHGPGAL